MYKFNQTCELYSPEIYHSADELYHYGVLGMKWRHKKAQWQTVRDAKKAYKQRNAKIQNTYFKSMENIEKGYKRGQMLSKKDQAKELRADTLATNSWKKSKAQLKSDIARAKAKYNKDVATSKKNREDAKNIVKEAKAKYKQSQKQYSKDFDNYAKKAWYTSKEAAQVGAGIVLNSAKKANKARDNYKKAKSDYKNLKKNW